MGPLYKPIGENGENFHFPSKFPAYLKLNGSWPTHGDDNSFWYRLQDKLYLCWSWIVIVCVTYIAGAEGASAVDNIKDIKMAIESACPCIIVLLSLLRLIHARFYMTKLRKVLGLFATDIWFNKESHPFIYERCLKRTLPPFYLCVAIWGVVIIYSARPVVTILTTENFATSTDKLFPYLVIVPYDLQNIWNYIFTFILATFVAISTLGQLYGMDSLLAFSISFVSGQFDILHGSIVRIIPECYAEWTRQNGGGFQRNGKTLRGLQDMYTRRLYELADRHEVLIRFCVELEQFFTVPLMITFVLSTFQICLNSLLFLVSVNTARYLYACNWEGGRLSINSPLLIQTDDMDLKELSSKLPSWKSLDYYPTNIDFQHKLHLMIMRSHRSVHLTAMKFASLSLESFSQILSSSLSYFALLKSFLDNENN